jgi:hypothetical protein
MFQRADRTVGERKNRRRTAEGFNIFLHTSPIFNSVQ